MKLTARDIRILRDLILSFLLSRDQIVTLYFGSVTRANARMRVLRNLGLVKVIDTPFFGQSLYVATPQAAEVVGERLAPLAATRIGSPRFLQHALAVTNCRVALLAKGATAWRFEQQATTSFRAGGKELEVRPDGLAIFATGIVAIEVDLGHVAPAKFRQKLLAYDMFVRTGECLLKWGEPSFTLVVTSGPLRASRLSRLTPKDCTYTFSCKSHDRLGIPFPGAWS